MTHPLKLEDYRKGTIPLMTTIQEALSANPYPGRLIVLARTLDGHLAAGYALTGRSASSKARRLEPTPEGDLAAVPVGDQAHDALRHYVAATAESYAWAQAYLQGYGWVDFDPTDTTDTIALPSSTAAAPAPITYPSASSSTTAEPTSAASTGGVSVYSPEPIPT